MRIRDLKVAMNRRAPRVHRALKAIRASVERILWRRMGRRPLPANELVTPSISLRKQRLVRKYARRHRLRVFVETGTFQADMVYGLRASFARLVTIELDKGLHAKAAERMRPWPHVEVLQGDSGEMLRQVLKSLDEPAVFFLDAHYSGGITASGTRLTPILDEVAAVLGHGVQGHVILVDDAWWHDGSDGKPTEAEIEKVVRRLRPQGRIRRLGEIMIFEP